MRTPCKIALEIFIFVFLRLRLRFLFMKMFDPYWFDRHIFDFPINISIFICRRNNYTKSFKNLNICEMICVICSFNQNMIGDFSLLKCVEPMKLSTQSNVFTLFYWMGTEKRVSISLIWIIWCVFDWSIFTAKSIP